jgi:hypothetical protein
MENTQLNISRVDKKSFLEALAALPKKDQIEIVLCGFMHPIVTREYADKDEFHPEDATTGEMAKAFSVTPEEVREHLKRFGFKNCFEIKTEIGSEGGTYIVKIDGKNHMYALRNGYPSEERVFATYQEAVDRLGEDMIDYYMSIKESEDK